MSVELHRRAEAMMADADLAKRENRMDEAGRLFSGAGRVEEEAFHSIPRDRLQTRGIIAVSAVALYRDGGDLDEAERFAHFVLGLRDPPLLEPAREELNDLLGDVVRQRRMAIGDTQYATQSFDIAFEGARADEGYAALETVSLKLQQLKALLVRIGEWKQGLQFRIAGSPPRSFEQLIVPLMGQPSFGSFRFELRMGAPRQPQLPGMVPDGYDGSADLPDLISDGFIDIVSAVSQAEAVRLQEYVPDEHYRSAFVRLIRNLAPDGKDIERIHIRRTAGGSQREAEITRDTVSLIRQAFPIAPQDAGAERAEVVGVLRALSLDKRYLRLVPEQGKSIQCTYDREVLLDDAVGPFVNHRVRAFGELRAGRLHVYDIVEDIPSDTPPDEDTDPLTT